jgi:hypothetical protein
MHVNTKGLTMSCIQGKNGKYNEPKMELYINLLEHIYQLSICFPTFHRGDEEE